MLGRLSPVKWVDMPEALRLGMRNNDHAIAVAFSSRNRRNRQRVQVLDCRGGLAK
jgi:hypothetical protein